MPSTSISGTAFRLYPDAAVAVVGEKSLTITETVENLDANSKDDANFNHSKIGRRGVAISCGGLADPGDAGFELLQNGANDGTALTAECKSFNSEQYSGTVNPTGFSMAATDTDLVNYTYDGVFTGTVTIESDA